MSDTALISAQTSPAKTYRKPCLTIRRMAMVTLICCVTAGSVLADTVTYQQLQQNQSGGATTQNASRPKDQGQPNNHGQGQSASLLPSDSAAGVWCGSDKDAQPLPWILVPDPTSSQSPWAQPTPPPSEIPEPGTLVLLGLGIGAIVARQRMAAKKDREEE